MKKLLKIMVWLVALLILLVGVGIYRLEHAKQYAIFEGSSMEPTLHAGQKYLVQPYPKGTVPHRGDIVEYSSSNALVKKYAPSGLLIHRVIGLPGEKVKIANNQVTIYNTDHPDGFSPDTFLNNAVKTYPDMELTVPQGSYFLLGDNRPNALDSRVLGPIPASAIIGKINP